MDNLFSSSPFTSPVWKIPHSTHEMVPTSPGADSQEEPRGLSDDVSDDTQDSPFFHTQPTQIVNRTSLHDPATALRSSPPSKREVIEIPASSPFQPRKPSGPRLIGGLMAPAGTSFRPPQRPSPPLKRRAESSDDELAPVPHVIDDSSDDDRPARGNIQLSSFKRQQIHPPSSITARRAEKIEAKGAFNTAADKRTEQLAAKMCKLYRADNFTLDQAKRALKARDNSIEEALGALRAGLFLPIEIPLSSLSSTATPASTPSTTVSSKSSQPSRTPSPKPLKIRRLQQGRRPAPRPASPKETTKRIRAPKPLKSRIVNNVASDSDDDEGYNPAKDKNVSKDEVGTVVLTFDRKAKILNYLNTCTVEGLQSAAKIKKEEATHMISKRPFANLEWAQSVTHTKTSHGKRKRYSLGADVVDDITTYVSTLDSVDKIIGDCELQGKIISSTIRKWRMDLRGRITESSLNKSGPVLPYPREPSALQGHCTMQDYQLYGMNWMFKLYQEKYGAILADDMGLGKTCQIVSFMALLVDNYDSGMIKGDQPWPNLIVVPPSTLANWEIEFEKFAPGLSIITFSGSQSERDGIAEDILSSPKEYHVILTSYSQMNRGQDIEAMRDIHPHVAVYDEGHKMKNPNAKIYKEMSRIKADWRIILTGTPIQNNIMEMVSLLKFINPGLFRDADDVVARLFEQKVSLEQVSQGAVLVSDRVNRARSILEPFILQRKKEHVLTIMPPKVRSVVYCDLHEDQKAIYQEFEKVFKRDKSQVQKTRTAGRKNDQNNVWIQLRKSAGHPQLFRRFFDDKKVEKMAKTLMDCVSQDDLRQPNLQHLTNELKESSDFQLHLWCRDYRCLRKFDCPDGSWLKSGKVEKLLELVAEYKKNGDRVLVFSRFALVTSILQECLASAGINYRVLQGETPVVERQYLINEFTEDQTITVFLLTTGAGGTGINLTAANKVILFDQSDNPQDDIQAENRAHRLGQEREVQIIRFLSKGTIDELVYKACQKKLELAGKITGHLEDISSEDMATIDIDMEAEVRKQLVEKEAEDN